MVRVMNTMLKARITQALGRAWRHGEVAQMAGVHRTACSMEINCTEGADCRARHSPTVQEAIAKAVGTSVGELFGKHAWFRLAGKALRRRVA